MKKTIVSLLITIAFGIFLSGCGESNVSTATSLERLEKYSTIAIVCAPQAGASPDYASVILEQVQKMAPSRLGMSLKKVTCVKDASIDLSSSTPVVNFPGKEEYDGIVCLLYGYNKGLVTMDIKMLDNGTGKEIWSHQLATKDIDVRGRLNRHGYWVPTTLKMHFYKKK